jgi:acetylserotonin N-methyltransferase
MNRRNPRAFPIDDRRVYDAYIAGRMSAALAAAMRCGLFDLLDPKPLSLVEISRQTGFAERPLRSLLSALIAMELVHRNIAHKPPLYSLSEEASAYLVRGKSGWLGGLIDLEIEHFLSPRALLDALKRDTASVYGEEDPWEHHEEDLEAARRFTRAMHSVSERPAAGLAEVVDFGSTQSLLDVGGGSGALSIAIARAWPGVRCVIWDLPVVCTFARENAAEAGVADRVTAEPGNMFKEDFPRGHDAILLSQILHDWTPEKGRLLLHKAKAALPSGGRVLIHEKLVDEDGRAPLANALVHLDMLVWTEGQQFTEQELREMLDEAGFGAIERKATAGYWSVIEARA